MSPPVEELGDRDTRSQRDTEDEERVRPASLLRALAVLRSAGGHDILSRLEVLGRLAPCPCGDETRLHVTKERRVLSERLRELRHEAARAGGTIGQTLELVRSTLHEGIASGHFLTGGCSPVATRQMREATVRAPIVAAAPRPA
jgi:hypothetical protein